MRQLTEPRSVAVIGASSDTRKISGRIIPALDRGGFDGEIYPINPASQAIAGYPSYATIGEVREPIDLAIIAVSQSNLATVLADCAAKRVPFAIVHAAGFGEIGTEGARLENELRRFVSESGVRILGPNCQGIAVPSSNFYASFNGVLARPEFRQPGNVAWIAQSGAVGGVATTLLTGQGLGLSLWASTGNEVDIDFCELAGYALDRPDTDIVCGYVESIRNVEDFRRLAYKAASLCKPVIVVKGGTSIRGAEAAKSHTGALVGNRRRYEALFRQSGVIQVDSLEDMAVLAALFAADPSRRWAPAVGILGNSGGMGVLLSDYAEAAGLRVPSPEATVQSQLAELLPRHIVPSNPVDIPSQIRSNASVLHEFILALDGQRDNPYSVYIVSLHSVYASDGYDIEQIVAALCRAERETGKPVILLSYASDAALIQRVRDAGIAAFDDGRRLVMALAAAAGWHAGREEAIAWTGAGAASGDQGRAIESAPVGGAGQVREDVMKTVLAQLGLEVVEGIAADGQDDAAVAGGRLGFPVVAKLVSPQVSHKAAAGALVLDIPNEARLSEAYEYLVDVAARLNSGAPPVVLIERMATEGQDMVVSVNRDPRLGLIVTLGMGGSEIEAIGDVAVRIAPVSAKDVDLMLGELLCSSLIVGPESNLDLAWLRRVVMVVQSFAYRAPWLGELELNPVRLYAAGHGGVILDALAHSNSATRSGGHEDRSGEVGGLTERSIGLRSTKGPGSTNSMREGM